MQKSVFLSRLSRRVGRCFGLIALALIFTAKVQAQDELEQLTNEWVVELAPGADPDVVARNLGAENLGAVSGFERVFLFRALEAPLSVPKPFERGKEPVGGYATRAATGGVLWGERQVARYRSVRALPDPQDPEFANQWHLENTGQGGGASGEDIAVRGAWELGYSGAGVNVVVVDDAVQHTHPDLQPVYRADMSEDLKSDVSGDRNPLPVLDDENHGTAVAGIIVAQSNDTAGVGVAPGVRFGAVRAIEAPLTDVEEAIALTTGESEVDIYNNSWGPPSEFGLRLQEPSTLSRRAIRDLTTGGRNGRGVIYVWAAGNGGDSDDNVNYDGYVNSRYTVAVGAVDENGVRSAYSEPGAALHVVAPSRNAGVGIVTTDRTGDAGYAPGDVTATFGGTSAAAPIVTGVVALMLDANPLLGWRDVQEILMATAQPVDLNGGGWVENGSGMWVNHNYGAGRVHAKGAVVAAAEWENLDAEMTLDSGIQLVDEQIPNGTSAGLNLTYTETREIRIESVEIVFDANHGDWGDLRVSLVSPSGLRSELMDPHTNVGSGYSSWVLTSQFFRGESPVGEWTLEVADLGISTVGRMESWRMRIYGSPVVQGQNGLPVIAGEELEAATLPVTVNVLENDSDPDGDQLEVIAAHGGRNGEWTLSGDGQLEYWPDNGFRGVDAVTYTVSDGRNGVRTSLVTILVPLPEAANDHVVVQPGVLTSLPVMENDFDPQNDPLSIVSVGEANFGRVVWDGGMTVSYEAPAGFWGIDRFSYTVTDGKDGEDAAEVVVLVDDSTDRILSFDGEDDKVVVAPTSALNLRSGVTMEAWIYPTGWGENGSVGFGRIFDKNSFLLFLNGEESPFYEDRSLVFYMEQSNGEAGIINTRADSIQLNTWQHVAASYDGQGNAYVFINGVQQAAIPTSAGGAPTLGISSSAGDPLHIGEAANEARAFEGFIDEARLWRRGRTPAEVTALWNQELNGGEVDLVGYWSFDEGLGGELIDGSGNQHTGMREGALFTIRDAPLRRMESLFPGTRVDLNGWRESAWYGLFFADLFPYVWHLQHGWVFIDEASSKGIWSWYPDAVLGWMWTDESTYPFIWRGLDGRWLWYERDSSGPRIFYDLTAEEVLSIQ